MLAKRSGLYANIAAKRHRIKAGSKEKMCKPGTKGAPTAKAIRIRKDSEETQTEVMAEKLKAEGKGATEIAKELKIGSASVYRVSDAKQFENKFEVLKNRG